MVRPASVFVLAALLAPLLGTSRAAAQEIDLAEARRRAGEELRCLDVVTRQITATVELLRDAEAQMTADSLELRQHAAQAVEALEDRLDDLADRLKACLPQTSRPAVRTVIRERTGIEASVGVANDATVVVERDRPLAAGVVATLGERVDGTGRLEARTVATAMRGIGDALRACYDGYLERGALQEGQLILAFTVGPGTGVSRVQVEGATLGDARFSRCVATAGRGLRFGAPPRGGPVRFAYTLAFGEGD
ncbi:MAG: AgmX/PglI C-terminal domain-containing protein [Myxococcota bacterium]